ncbi:MAG: HD domain-containing protein, partial [Butyrivibrio sp.]|nr:HD domain-containing protein [Butyrivibrio sp.]
MRFIRAEELKPGMRLARPIYSKQGALLYDRAAVLKDQQSIENIKGFGLIGLFVLEPAEPVPPMTDQDKEFERFQTMMTFQIRDELTFISKNHKTSNMMVIAANIIRDYGNLKEKLTFIQGLRSKDDYIYKHSLNVAILCAVLSHTLKLTPAEQNEVVLSAIIHDIGRLQAPAEIVAKRKKSPEERDVIAKYEVAGHSVIDDVFMGDPNIRRICAQSQQLLMEYKNNSFGETGKLSKGAKILAVAGTFDVETAVQIDTDPSSEVSVIKKMLKREDIFDYNIVQALMSSLNILVPGVSVELNNGEKALVITENPGDIMHPIVLSFKTNKMLDLSRSMDVKGIEIVDIMKTMDNRVVIKDVSGFNSNPEPTEARKADVAHNMSMSAF